MRTTIPLLVVGFILATVVVCTPVLLYSHKHFRIAAINDCSVAQTQVVALASAPARVHWRISGRIEGTGKAIIPYAFSNLVSGSFSMEGTGDYYQTNAWLIFIPEGPAKGWLRASFRFDDIP